jgi:hypothetical protein
VQTADEPVVEPSGATSEAVQLRSKMKKAPHSCPEEAYLVGDEEIRVEHLWKTFIKIFINVSKIFLRLTWHSR